MTRSVAADPLCSRHLTAGCMAGTPIATTRWRSARRRSPPPSSGCGVAHVMIAERSAKLLWRDCSGERSNSQRSAPRSVSWCSRMFDAPCSPRGHTPLRTPTRLLEAACPLGPERMPGAAERGCGGAPKPPIPPPMSIPPVSTLQAPEVPLFSTLPLPTRRAWRTMAAFDLGHNGSHCGQGVWVPVDVRLYALAGSEQQAASSSS